jgi:deoxyuridine 5'-triphosphate nucleotidohydrolase
MDQLELNIIADNKSQWLNHVTYNKAMINQDTGLDIPIPKSITIPAESKAFTIDLGFKAEQNQGYMLVPRSSISKTPLRLANSIGIIDKSYRGKVMVKLDNNSSSEYIMNKGNCYFQIVAFNGILPKYNLVDSIDSTIRGEGGFGSSTI